jgi:RNA-directed DNA polymerase
MGCLEVNPKLERFKERITRLYEQGADEYRIGQYVRRFTAWAQSPLQYNSK